MKFLLVLLPLLALATTVDQAMKQHHICDKTYLNDSQKRVQCHKKINDKMIAEGKPKAARS